MLAYSVASVSGTVLAVCSCTVLPLFAGIYTRGAGIGPATAFKTKLFNILDIKGQK
ncbi:MAG: permease [Desulfobacteraceae bacterium]